MQFPEWMQCVLSETTAALEGVQEGDAEKVVAMILSAPRIFVLGLGRSGLILRMFAMRLMQIGLRAYVVGDATTPAIGAGDLLIVLSGSGRTETVLLLARKAKEHGLTAVLVSSDKDILQLVSDDVFVLDPMKNNLLIDERKVVERMGVMPRQIPDLLGLWGDSSDNIPGVPGVGPKTAAKWLRQYGSLDAILAHAEQIQPEKLRQKLIADRDRILATRPLVELRTDVPLTFSWDAARPGPIRQEAARQLCEELGFRSLLPEIERLPTTAGDTPRKSSIAVNAHIIDDLQALRELADRLRTASCISIDTETTDVRPRWASLVGIALSTDPGAAYYIPLRT